MSMTKENPWIPSDRTREPAELMKPIREPASWYAHQIRDSACWVYRMSDSEVAEVLDAVAWTERESLSLMDIDRDRFPLSYFGDVLNEIRDEVMQGRGFAVLRGLPVDGRTRARIATAFWGIGTYLGSGLIDYSQKTTVAAMAMADM